MNKKATHFYMFGAFRLDAVMRLLLRDGQPVSLPPKALETLIVLVENAGQLVEKGELMKKV
jgi:DNA-binding winged helix-turn-helix (wHTH) protein